MAKERPTEPPLFDLSGASSLLELAFDLQAVDINDVQERKSGGSTERGFARTCLLLVGWGKEDGIGRRCPRSMVQFGSASGLGASDGVE